MQTRDDTARALGPVVQSHQGPKKDNGVPPVRGSTKQSMNRWLPRFWVTHRRAAASGGHVEIGASAAIGSLREVQIVGLH
jgi:hypothetical protein